MILPVPIVDSFRPLSSADILSLKAVVGKGLPLDFILFLLRFNGGRPSVPLAVSVGHQTHVVDFFLGLSERRSDDWARDILQQSALLKPVGLPDFLPFATTTGGGAFCFDLQNQSIVLVQDDSTKFVSKHFTGFIGKLALVSRIDSLSEADEAFMWARVAPSGQAIAAATEEMLARRDTLGRNLLMHLAEAGRNDVLTAVAASGLSHFFVRDGHNRSVLHWAVSGSSLDCARTCLVIGLDPLEADLDGETPLSRAVDRQDWRMVRELSRCIGIDRVRSALNGQECNLSVKSVFEAFQSYS